MSIEKLLEDLIEAVRENTIALGGAKAPAADKPAAKTKTKPAAAKKTATKPAPKKKAVVEDDEDEDDEDDEDEDEDEDEDDEDEDEDDDVTRAKAAVTKLLEADKRELVVKLLKKQKAKSATELAELGTAAVDKFVAAVEAELEAGDDDEDEDEDE